MAADLPATVDVLIRCDLGPTQGVGHLMRCIALSEEAMSRGLSVVVCADVAAVPFAGLQLRKRHIAWVPPVSTADEHVSLVRRLGPKLVVIDSYVLSPAVYAAVREERCNLLALVDGPIGAREADVFLDQNIGAEFDDHAIPAGSVRLAGLTYALMRDEVLRHRPAAPLTGAEHDPLRVHAFFGGTDAFGAAPEVMALVAKAGVPAYITCVAGTPAIANELKSVEMARNQAVEVIAPTDELPAQVASADVVLSASGTSAWELACLGAAAGLVCVVDNQVVGYARVVATGSAVGLGRLADVAEHRRASLDAVTTLLTDASLRARLRSTAWSLVDGRGRVRVMDAVTGA